MITPLEISYLDARKLVLHSQGLLNFPKNSLRTIEQLSYVQIDTISVTERAHNHVLFNRNPTFKPDEIHQLMEDKAIFEYWSHAAAYLPMKDFRFSLYRKEQYKNGGKHWFPREKKVEKYVLDQINRNGPMQSRDFENLRTKNHEWYEWKPAKIALTNLFMDGSLMIGNRKGFQKIFDLTENVVPDRINTTTPTLDEYCNHLIFNAIKAHGLVTLNEIVYLRKGIKPTIKKLLKQLVKSGELILLKLESSDSIYYSTNELLKEIDQLKLNKDAHILSPFDNLVIQRKRIKELFNFDYQIECYVPEKKRIFGYYALPVLYGDNFVARLDAKADRKTKIFTVKGLWFENKFIPTDDFYFKFSEKLKAYSIFCGCDHILISDISPSKYKKPLASFI